MTEGTDEQATGEVAKEGEVAEEGLDTASELIKEVFNPTDPPATKKLSIKEIMALKVAVTKKVVIQLNGAVAEQISDFRMEVRAAELADETSNRDPSAPKLQKELDTLIEVSAVSEITFEFKSIGRYAYDELVENPQYKATKVQLREGTTFNPDTFPPALVAASCVSPKMTKKEATDIFSDPEWNGAELQRLFFGALECNTETGDIPLSRSGSDSTLSSLLRLATQPGAESLTQSSSDE